jgi:iron(III) transport system ATP-binding protein
VPGIELDSVSKRFGGQTLLTDFSLRIQSGSAATLLGPSGVGKTTVLRMVAGLERPDAGRVILRDQVVDDGVVLVPPLNRRIGMVFQDFALWPHMTVVRHLEFVLRAVGLDRESRLERTQALLDLCDLHALRKTRPGTLSGGEQQRLAVARALATEPDILLLDEPFSNLDDPRRDRIVEFLSAQLDAGVTILTASHSPDELGPLLGASHNLSF